MQVVTLVDAASSNGNHDLVMPGVYKNHPEAVVQIEISGTASVQILGRVDPNLSFVEVVAAVTANTLQPIAWMPELRATISGVAATPTIDVKVLVGDSARY